MTFGLRAIGVIIGILLIVSPAFGEAIAAETINIDIDDAYTDSKNVEVVGDDSSPAIYFNRIHVRNPVDLRAPFTLILFTKITIEKDDEYAGYMPILLKPEDSDSICGHGTMGYQIFPDNTGYVWLDIESFNFDGVGWHKIYITTPDGKQFAGEAMSLSVYSFKKSSGNIPPDLPLAFGATVDANFGINGIYTYNTHKEFKQKIIVTYGNETDKSSIDNIAVARVVDGKPYHSTVEISAKSGVYHQSSSLNAPISVNISSLERPYQINVFGRATETWYNKTVLSGADDTPVDPDNIPVVVYVKSTQTGALLNDARIIIKDTNTVPWSEVVNQTLPTGSDVVYLKKDPGFDPTQYQISVKVPGYQQVVPTHFFRVTGPMSVVVEMEPLEGGPVDEDNTFLEFYVTDLDSNPVSNAQVYVGGQLRWTNAQGYTQFEVAKNTSYSYDVSKSGYVTVRGSATAGDGPRYTVNVVLGPKTEPTEPPITDPDTFPVNVYVKSSQTGALLADARVIIKDTTTDPWMEVVNQTLPSGHGAVSLAKDPGFNPTQYQISVTVPDYQQVVPALFFRVTGPTNVVVEMEPIEGGPVDEDNTFLEFYVRNLDGNPVSNAQVYVDGQLRWTNAQGWIQFEVAKNASYPYTVSKSGYVTIEGTTTVGDDPRYTVNVVLGPKTDPTEPPGPGVPTPPGGIPDEDDDSDGFMMQAVRGIANLFGVSFGVGKTILGMLLALGIGTATAKHLRGGAQEFGMGMLGGVVLGVLIGLLPIWVLVLLVLIVGLWIGQRYMSGGDS